MKPKKTYLRIFLLVATLISLLFVPWDLLRVWLTPKSDNIQEQVNTAIEMGLDAIIIYVDQGGKEPTLYSSGWENRETKTPADPNVLFKIASISKLYIAVATTKLVNIGSLSLDKTLAEYLPELTERIDNSDQITLRMMVKHISGIPNYSDHPDYPWENPPNNDNALELILDTPADFEPGQQYSYSNTNYLLIGEILDRTLGYSHHQYIKEEILNPLGLNNTYSLLSEVDIDDVMSGYYVGYEPDIKGNDFTNPGGSMIATIEDVGIFLRALNTGSLLDEEEQTIYASIYEFSHTGLLPGYSSIARYHKDIDAVVIQFVNTSGGNSWSKTEMVYNHIIKIVREKQHL
ncbi:MAG: beta-lactamase family protein [Balneolaceae bacterium]|nr:beta-lactamase family protein [Balneolaceae bacterium]MBO6547764.1 beta-lactamase family protein [Balneolaceae bacterium]MBO6648275.1 beta-lactamase family protein [Balneolaceae bacterium]